MNVGGGVNDGRWGTWWGKIEPDIELPIQLTSFSGGATSGGVIELHWSTISEVNNYGFFVERRPEISPAFVTISDFIAGSGTTLEEQHYSWTDVNVAPGSYVYRLRQVDLNGDTEYSFEIIVTLDAVLDVTRERKIPEAFSLRQNYPNPFNPSTLITYEIPERSIVKLEILTVLGQRVAELANDEQEPGEYRVAWNALSTGIASGIYYYRMEAVPVIRPSDRFVKLEKMIVAK